jgi:hypothetical protein
MMFSLLFALLAAEPITQTAVDGAGYFPVLTQLKDGRLAAVLRGGAPHIGRAGRLDWITSKDQGRTWSRPVTLVDTPEDDRNPAFGQLKDGTLIVAYCILSGYGPDGKLAGARKDRVFDGVYVMRSTDNGQTWSPGRRSAETRRPPGDKNVVSTAVSPYGKIVQLKDGTALLAVYYEATLTDSSMATKPRSPCSRMAPCSPPSGLRAPAICALPVPATAAAPGAPRPKSPRTLNIPPTSSNSATVAS